MPPNNAEYTLREALPPLVLVHGWGGAFEASFGSCGWREAAAVMGRVLVEIDLPGHGPAPASCDPAAYRDLAAGLEERLPADTLDAVGFSLGGKLLIELAIRHPSWFRRIVIAGLGDNIFAPERAGEALAQALEKGVGHESPGTIAALVAYSQASHSNPLAIAAVLRRPANPVITPERLQKLNAELLIVNGAEDSIAQPDTDFLAALPNARGIVLPGAGHLDLPSNPLFLDLALEFLNRGRLKDGNIPQQNQAEVRILR